MTCAVNADANTTPAFLFGVMPAAIESSLHVDSLSARLRSSRVYAVQSHSRTPNIDAITTEKLDSDVHVHDSSHRIEFVRAFEMSSAYTQGMKKM
mmetsp:Transcript_120/g.308  ORF Transcript_120/g.308 Transcript_120/m.308 type:complete len:95 (-) Transcript_120:623-907(-)